MAREFYYDWHVHLTSPPDKLWPLAADTNRFNRDTGLPPLTHVVDADDVRPGARRLRFRIFGVRVEWDEEPFEWIFPYRFGVVRHYKSGPVAQMRVLTTLQTRPEGGTDLRYQVWAQPSNLLGNLAIPLQIGLVSARQFVATFKHYDREIQAGHSALDLPGRVHFAPGGRERLEKSRERVVRRPGDTEIWHGSDVRKSTFTN